MRREAGITPTWEKYCRKKPLFGVFELKQTRSDKFYFKNFEPHQIDSLMAVEEAGTVFKWSDMDPRLKPFDVASLPPMPAFLVIKFPQCFVMIRINEFVNFMNNTQSVFISYDQAKKIATKMIYHL